MAQVENVVIQITTKATTRQIRQARNELLKLAAAGKINGETSKTLSNRFEQFDRNLKKFQRTSTGVLKFFESLNKVTIKLFTIGFAIGSAALMANNALFATGRFLVKAYQAAMSGLAVVVAAVGAGLAVAAAAMTEYTAAVNAYAYKSSPALKSRLAESSSALRGIEADATLATFGMQSLSQAFAAISKSAPVTGTSRTLLKGLADFAAAGGDPAKNLAAAGEFIGLLQKSGQLDAKTIQAAQGIGPTFVEALKKARASGVSTLAEFKAMLSSGELARLGGVEGQAALVGQTVMGQFRAMGVQLKSIGVDFGQSLLAPLKNALRDIFRSFTSTLARVGPEMTAFGRGPALDSIVRFVEKLEDLTVNLFRKYLPAANGMLQRFADWWKRASFFAKSIADRLRSLLPGGSVIIDTIGKPLVEAFGTTGAWIRYIAEKAVKNKATFTEFGNALSRAIQKIQDIGKKLIDVFVEAMPFLGQILDWAGNLLDLIMRLVGAVGMLGNMFGGLAGLLGGRSEGLGAFAQLAGLLIGGAFLRGKVRQMRGLPTIFAGNAGNGLVRTAQQRYMNWKGNRAVQSGYLQQTPMFGMFGPPVGGPGAQGMRRLPRLINAYRGAGRGGAGFAGRMAAANTAGMRYNAQNGMFPRGLGGMVPGAAMLTASMFAAPEAQGALQAGGSIAMLAPLLGKFGPMASLAGLGIAGYGIMKNARTGGGGALGGAMTGASIGGAIGTVVPVIGTAVGMVLGAVAGSVVGFVKGKARGEKIKAEKAVNKFMEQNLTGIAAGMVRGDTDAMRSQIDKMKTRAAEIGRLNEAFFQAGTAHSRVSRIRNATMLYEQGKITRDEMEGLINAPGTYANKLKEQAELTERVLTPGMTKFDTASKLASTTLGMTTEELMQLAMEQGVNLFDTTVSLRDQMHKLGIAMNYTKDQIVGAIRDIAIKGLDAFQAKVDAAMAPQVMNELAESLYSDFVSGGEISTDRMGKFITDMYNQLNIFRPNAPLTNVQTLVDMFGAGGAAFAPGMQLAGMGGVFAPVSGMIDTLGRTTQQEAAATLTDMIVRQGLFGGVAFNREDLQSRLQGMSLTELQRLQSQFAGGALGPDVMTAFTDATSSYQAAGGRQLIGTTLQRMGLGGLTFEEVSSAALTMEQQIALYGEEGAAIINGMNKVLENAFQNKPDWMKEAPEWFNAESFEALIDAAAADTSTPRGDTTSSRLGRTLRRHSYFDSLLTGSRTMTSSYRRTNLGSINSDHITGKAYDLVGQNLGAYATMVNRSGGFAEFHGRGGSRHLHVVPGETPVGDDAAPYMGAPPAMSSSGSTTNYYNFTVNGTPGMDVNALADAVMTKIQRVERSNRERS